MAENSNEPDRKQTPEQNLPPIQEEMPADAAAEAKSKAKAPDLKTPSVSRRVTYSIFNRETRMGRFLRTLLRSLVLVVVLFALGVLATYLLLYRPTAQKLQNGSLMATQTSGNFQLAREDLTKAQQDLKNAQTQADQAKSNLETELTLNQVLRAQNAVTTAKLALAKNDKAAAANALQDAQAGLKKIQPQLDKLDANQFSTLQAIFTLVKTDLDRDPALASQDLDRMQSELTRIEKALAQ